MSNQNNIGGVLKALIKESGMTQREIAKLLFVTEGTMSNYVNNKTSPPYEVCVGLSIIFGVSVDYLLGKDTKISDFASLNAEEIMLIECYRTTNAQMKRYLMQVLLSLKKNFPLRGDNKESNGL